MQLLKSLRSFIVTDADLSWRLLPPEHTAFTGKAATLGMRLQEKNHINKLTIDGLGVRNYNKQEKTNLQESKIIKETEVHCKSILISKSD